MLTYYFLPIFLKTINSRKQFIKLNKKIELQLANEVFGKRQFILKELIKMNPKDGHSIRFFRKSQLHRPPSFVQNTRNVSLLLFLFTAMVICFEMAYFGFGKSQSEMGMIIEIARNIVFLSGWLVLILGDGIFRWKVFKETKDFIKTIHLQKNKKAGIPVFSEK